MIEPTTSEDDAIDRVYRALASGALGDDDLSARRIAAFLGKTTGAIYHRWGSFDGLLFTVSQRGFVDLKARLDAAWAARKSLADCAVAYVEFGLDHPRVYPLMFERRFDWHALREGGYFNRTTPSADLLVCVVGLVGAAGARDAIADTRLLMAGLHGLVSFAASGRMNAGDLSSTDRAIAVGSARDLASRVALGTPVDASKKTPPRGRK